MQPHDPTKLPDDLPAPQDDGACAHLEGSDLPVLALASTSGRNVALRDQPSAFTVFYCYPRTGRPGQELPTDWNLIPGARGCTPQSCAFRDHRAELDRLGAVVYGISTQDTDYQREAVERLHLPFELLSDADLALAKALKLPTFSVDGMTLLKRVTFIAAGNRIEKVFYPVFPPDRNAGDVIAWLEERAR